MTRRLVARYLFNAKMLVPASTLLLRATSSAAVGLHPDVRAVIAVPGGVRPGPGWADSYSVGDECYCDFSSLDHDAGDILVETPFGWKSVTDVCQNIIGRGPGRAGRPVYNDVQCGNGPPNTASDEHKCPGRTDMGPEGCGHIGPKWKFPMPDSDRGVGIPVTLPVATGDDESLHTDITIVVNVTGIPYTGGVKWADSYSVDDRCYCASSFDQLGANLMVETPLGWKTVKEVCDLLGTGPGIAGRPAYNDIQCGHGPPSYKGDEHLCPGRIDIGPQGCGQIGPRWNFEDFIPDDDEEEDDDDEEEGGEPVPIHPDVVTVVSVVGVERLGSDWFDSYSVGDDCFCDVSSLDHGIADAFVETPFGWKTVQEICLDIIGEGPGMQGRPLYNDVQCGNGPPNNAGSEHVCPGRVDVGPGGCGHVGPKWKFPSSSSELASSLPLMTPPADAHSDILAMLPVPGTVNPGGVKWADSYSVGNECFCVSSFDKGMRNFWVETPGGVWMTVPQVCAMLGPGPGRKGRPAYNDVQCGNGPPSWSRDEIPCPGRTDVGPQGCGQIGPRWNFGSTAVTSDSSERRGRRIRRVGLGRLWHQEPSP